MTEQCNYITKWQNSEHSNRVCYLVNEALGNHLEPANMGLLFIFRTDISFKRRIIIHFKPACTYQSYILITVFTYCSSGSLNDTYKATVIHGYTHSMIHT